MLQREEGAEALGKRGGLGGEAGAQGEDRGVLSFGDTLGHLGRRCCCHFCGFVGCEG